MDIMHLIGYNHAVRRLYFDALVKLPWQQMIEPRGLSYDSLRNVFLHITVVEDRWVSYIIPDRFDKWVDPEFDAFNSIESMKTYMEKVEANTKNLLSAAQASGLSRKINVPWGGKPYKQLSVEEILTHMVMEDMVHYGELSASLWQMGLEAPYLGFWRYLTEVQRL